MGGFQRGAPRPRRSRASVKEDIAPTDSGNAELPTGDSVPTLPRYVVVSPCCSCTRVSAVLAADSATRRRRASRNAPPPLARRAAPPRAVALHAEHAPAPEAGLRAAPRRRAKHAPQRSVASNPARRRQSSASQRGRARQLAGSSVPATWIASGSFEGGIKGMASKQLCAAGSISWC